MIYYLLLDRKQRYPSYEDEDLPPRNDVGQYNMGFVVEWYEKSISTLLRLELLCVPFRKLMNLLRCR